MIIGLMAAAVVAQGATELLPDCIIWDRYLAQAYIGTTSSSEAPAGRRALRFPTTTVNIGTGTLELRGAQVVDGRQLVNQRVYRSDGTFSDRLAGSFTYHSDHSHVHFDDWTQFRLREVTAGTGVGQIIRTGAKTSFCIIETTVYDSTMPGFNNSSWGPYGCGQLQGTRPGRADTYGSTLSGQYIDITGVPDGVYWLEGEVDPNNNVKELDETNNVTRVLVNIGSVPGATPDRFEENDTLAQTAARTEGAENSPNFGIVNSFRQWDYLSMDDNEDWYRFRLNNTATAGDYVRIESPYHSGQNLYLYLYNSAGQLLASVTDSYAFKQISLAGRPAGAYFVRVARNTGNNPRYMLSIEPAGNLPPNVTVTEPNVVRYYEKGHDLVPVRWTCNDPENDPKTLALLIGRKPIVDESNIPLSGYEMLRGSDLEANINTAYVPVGPWHVIARATDGGAFSHSVSPQPFWVYVVGDVNYDGVFDRKDYLTANKAYMARNIPPEMVAPGDLDHDGDFDKDDLRLIDKFTRRL